MKIISQPDHTWSTQITCRTCQAVLQVDATDLTVTYNRRGGNYGNYCSFRCPVCSCTCTINVKLVPQHIVYSLKSSR